eukprot:4203841-Pleurochrysis_carterae.AAC.3
MHGNTRVTRLGLATHLCLTANVDLLNDRLNLQQKTRSTDVLALPCNDQSRLIVNSGERTKARAKT